jgi:hypothetical protein
MGEKGGQEMRTVWFVVVAMVLAGVSTQASARSCNQIAAACLKIAVDGGSSKAEWQQKCFEPERMATCRKTLSYNAPSGKVWPATKP